MIVELVEQAPKRWQDTRKQLCQLIKTGQVNKARLIWVANKASFTEDERESIKVLVLAQTGVALE